MEEAEHVYQKSELLLSLPREQKNAVALLEMTPIALDQYHFYRCACYVSLDTKIPP